MAPTFPDKYRPHLLGLIVAAVFANSFAGTFVFDEYSSITNTDTVRHLWPLDCMFKYPNVTRPVVGLSFAINYAMHGYHFWPYHLFNYAIHITSALTLYGIALRTFLSACLKERYDRDAERLAFLIALLWAIHPLQTSSVTYVVQRCESMMGMFFLLTLYCAIRSADAFDPGKWTVWAIVFCALGMGSKQVMVAAPLLVLLYDRTFLSGSLKNAIAARGRLYAGLLVTCAILTTSMLDSPPQGASAGFSLKTVTPYHYALTQCQVIPYYLQLSFWPKSQCLDYIWPFVESAREVWPGIVLLSVLLLATLIGTKLNSPWGFVGAWFFAILAPSSSIMPILDSIFEHRMYLSLVSVVVVFVVGMHWIARTCVGKGIHPRSVQNFFGVVLTTVVLGLSVLTVLRNYDYALESRIWRKVVDMYPESRRGTNNLGNALAKEEQHVESVFWFEKCAKIDPNYADAQFNLAVELNILGRHDEAIDHYKRALEITPTYPNAHGFMADILVQLDRADEAVEHFEAELKRDPNRADLKEKLSDAQSLEIPDETE